MTRAGFPSTVIFAASSRALVSLSRTANDTVKPIFDESVGGASTVGRGRGRAVSIAGRGGGAEIRVVVSLSSAVANTVSTASDRGRRPFHVNAYQKSDAPPATLR